MLKPDDSLEAKGINMKRLILLIIVLQSMAWADKIPVDWTSGNVHSKEVENSVIIECEVQLQAGRKLILTGVESFTGSKESILWYQVVSSVPESFRHKEPAKVRWKISKDDFFKWKEERPFFVEQRDSVRLSEEHIEEIKKYWK